ncbi:unnamed protein product [Camellia sinensis]
MMDVQLYPEEVNENTGEQEADLRRMSEEEVESKFGGSDNNQEGGYDEDQGESNHPRKKRRYQRHTQFQIQEMENFFKEYPHPDDKQRKVLSRELGLEPLQIKFWFQNKRTQIKMRNERIVNTQLRNNNEKLRAENILYKEALSNSFCPSCGSQADLGHISLEEYNLRLENARLQKEVDEMSTIAANYVGKPLLDQVMSPPLSPGSFENEVLGGQPSAGEGELLLSAPGDLFGSNCGPTSEHYEKQMIFKMAVAAMEEFTVMVQIGDPLWIPGIDSNSFVLNEDEYLRMFPRAVGLKAPDFKREASRGAAIVLMPSINIVEILMDEEKWSNFFSVIVAIGVNIETLSAGVQDLNGALKVMSGEFQVLSPQVPAREFNFVRYCKQHGDGSWAVVDASVESLRPSLLVKNRRRPSGCLIQDLPNGYTKVTWIEHVEVDVRGVSNIYRPLVNCGLAFGAKRWLSTLNRQSERLAILQPTNLSPSDVAITSVQGKKSIMELAERMVISFCGGVGASATHTWTTLTGSGPDDIRVMTRRSIGDRGHPPGIALSAVTSFWLPAPVKEVFDFLRDAHHRNEWDILSSGGVIQEIAHIANGHRAETCISLLRVNSIFGDQNNMLILQESSIDPTGSFIIYAPVDGTAMNTVLHGGNPDNVALLPSGFAVLPDGPSRHGSGIGEANPGGSLVTVSFQILVDSTPTVTIGSVATVNNLITCTVERIKVAMEN